MCLLRRHRVFYFMLWLRLHQYQWHYFPAHIKCYYFMIRLIKRTAYTRAWHFSLCAPHPPSSMMMRIQWTEFTARPDLPFWRRVFSVQGAATAITAVCATSLNSIYRLHSMCALMANFSCQHHLCAFISINIHIFGESKSKWETGERERARSQRCSFMLFEFNVASFSFECHEKYVSLYNVSTVHVQLIK